LKIEIRKKLSTGKRNIYVYIYIHACKKKKSEREKKIEEFTVLSTTTKKNWKREQ